MTIRDLSVYDGLDYDSTVSGAGDGVGSEYVYWDKQSLMMCNCDNGYTGPGNIPRVLSTAILFSLICLLSVRPLSQSLHESFYSDHLLKVQFDRFLIVC